jgi:hypothetical protein
MKRFIISSLVAAGVTSFAGLASAEHDKSCKHTHGKVTVVTEEGIAVDDSKLFKVGNSTRIMKGERRTKLSQLTAGDMVCVDTRGKDDVDGGEVAAVTVLTLASPAPAQERQYVREKEVVRQSVHDKSCKHVHGKVTQIKDSVVMVDGKPYVVRETTRYTKGDQRMTFEKIKAGDFICLNHGDADDEDRKVTSIAVLEPSEASAFQPRVIIREQEKVKEKIREE